MFKKPKGYDEAKVLMRIPRLPKGAYVMEIIGANIAETRNGGQVLNIAMDVAEGEWKGHFRDLFNNSPDEKAKWKGVYRHYLPVEGVDNEKAYAFKLSALKTLVEAIQDSNKGFSWNWEADFNKMLKGKKIVGLCVDAEYDYNGRTGFWTKIAQVTDIESYENETYKMPPDELLEKPDDKQPVFDEEGFQSIMNTAVDDIPF